MNYGVFIQANDKQLIGALVAEYALRRNSKNSDKFTIRILRHNDYSFFQAQEGHLYLRDGVKSRWLNDDLQSFTPLRFMPPELMEYAGRAVVIDPDIFALGDIWELLSRDMQGKALLCRQRFGTKSFFGRCFASSVMLLDCAKLTHWRCEEQFKEMFEFKRDYQHWICLRLEPPETIGLFEPEWNDFDRLTDKTKLLHNTHRRTQPWKTGLPIDWRLPEVYRPFPPLGWLVRAKGRLFGEYAFLGRYVRHPDPNQERLFFGLLRECLEQGIISESLLRQEMQRNHVRHDAFEVIDRTPSLVC